MVRFIDILDRSIGDERKVVCRMKAGLSINPSALGEWSTGEI